MTKQMALPALLEEQQSAAPALTGMIRAIPRMVEVAKSGKGYAFRGVASTIGEIDRMHRCFLPGAFGGGDAKVPLLAFHDDTRPIGRSVLTPPKGQQTVGAQLLHQSMLPNAERYDDIVELIESGGIPATSIGWLTPEEDRYYGWAQLERRNPTLARSAAVAGVPQRDDVTYYASAEFCENSVVPIPAHRGALIAVASLMGAERGMVEEMLELSAGARHSSSDQAAIQRAHDALTEAGATCADTTPPPPGAYGTPAPADRRGITGGWGDHMHSSVKLSIAAPSVAALAETVDDAIDNAIQALQGEDVAGAQDALQTADEAMDDLMEALNVPDPDEDEARLLEIERAAQWSSSFINDLPDASFLYIAPGGKKDDDDKTTPRDLRYFPYKDDAGKVDLPHLRNALARIPQSDLSDDVKATVAAKAARIAKDNGIGEQSGINDQERGGIGEAALASTSGEIIDLDRLLAEAEARFQQ